MLKENYQTPETQQFEFQVECFMMTSGGEGGGVGGMGGGEGAPRPFEPIIYPNSI